MNKTVKIDVSRQPNKAYRISRDGIKSFVCDDVLDHFKLYKFIARMMNISLLVTAVRPEGYPDKKEINFRRVGNTVDVYKGSAYLSVLTTNQKIIFKDLLDTIEGNGTIILKTTLLM